MHFLWSLFGFLLPRISHRATNMMEVKDNAAWCLKERVVGLPEAKKHFEMKPVDSLPSLDEGSVLIRLSYVSVDPYMRGRMSPPNLNAKSKRYIGLFELGKPMTGMVAGVVMESKAENLKKGDSVFGFLPWQKYQVVNAKAVTKADTKEVPIVKYISSATYSGLSSYLPIKHIGEPKKGEVAFVSGGAGAVGSCACQIFKAMGCTVIASAGSPDKIKWLDSIGVKAFNYKTENPSKALERLCPEGIDIYFDNVGGPILDAALTHMKNFGRVICCGMISQYNAKEAYGVKNLVNVVLKRLKMQGFIMSDWQGKERDEAIFQLFKWIKEGKLKTTETIVQGFEKVPEAFLGLFEGKNLGKMLVKV